MTFRERIARFLAPEAFGAQEMRVNQRVADILFKMDPFEPLLKKYNVTFSEEWEKPEDRLDEANQLRLFMWAWGQSNDASFKHVTNWVMNTQGNATLRKGSNDPEWFYGRAAVATMVLFRDEILRLGRRYRDIIKSNTEDFDENLITSEL